MERYPQAYEDPSSTCVGARYIFNSAEGWVDVLNWEVINGTLETIVGTATVNSTDGSAKLEVILPVVGTNCKIFGNTIHCTSCRFIVLASMEQHFILWPT